MKTAAATAFVLLKVSSCSHENMTELRRFDDAPTCATIADAMNATNSNDWFGRKGLDRFVCVPSSERETTATQVGTVPSQEHP